MDLEEEPEEVYSVMLAISINSWQSLNKQTNFTKLLQQSKSQFIYLKKRNLFKTLYSKGVRSNFSEES